MTTKAVRWNFLAALLCLVGVLVWVFFTGPQSPVAVLRVVDAANHPIAGAVIRPEGLRTKPGPYAAGWYGWSLGRSGVANPPVTTDATGNARVPYPRYVFEHIETGKLCLSVEHPDYVPAQPEVTVDSAPPAGAPWRVRADYLWNRLARKVLFSWSDPIVLQKGAALKLSVKANASIPTDGAVFAQVSALETEAADLWTNAGPGMLVTRRLKPGPHTLRVVRLDAGGSPWFSPLVHLNAVAGQTNELELELKPGAHVAGRLDDRVPRPVRSGRVIAHVWPQGESPQSSPPQWHTWSSVREDGTFELGSLPAGQLELVALCDGFVSTNGPGQSPGFHYPQKQVLGTNDLQLTIGMEPSARLEVVVLDDQGKPLKDARVTTWPNVRYGEWAARLLGQDCYNQADALRGTNREPWWKRASSFQATSDASGLAVISNLPVEAREFSVEHPRFALPARDTGFGQKRREARIALQPGHTNRVAVQLEPLGRSAIAHY